ncbi:glycosyltransferase family 2 protein [Gryllotalpicola ginsengisoli]|uniref:glycosyltransferase family 2 protein n=1 Tax=Gryllotalpicola ginsengisoli TaxID=444608 RepID=UPI0003B4245F|nr:glycosyltransferase family 2 protein [Gryllotalpicola ginsengisoli]
MSLAQRVPAPALGAARRVKHLVQPLYESARLQASADQKALRARVHAAMELPRLPRRARVRGSVWAVTMVKNEADIIGTTLDHLLSQGVDGIIVADNGSTDATPDIVAGFAATGRVHLARDREFSYLQSQKMSLLADTARSAGADWIVPFDADELWFAPGACLAEGLRATDSPKAGARMYCLFPGTDSQLGDGSWRIDRLRYPYWLDKVAFRSHPMASLKQGNHTVLRPGEQTPALGLIHIPWRSFEQFRTKVRQGAAARRATIGGSELGGLHWLSLDKLSDAELRHEWGRLLGGVGHEDLGWMPRGELVPCEPLGWKTWDPEGLLTPVGVDESPA